MFNTIKEIPFEGVNNVIIAGVYSAPRLGVMCIASSKQLTPIKN